MASGAGTGGTDGTLFVALMVVSTDYYIWRIVVMATAMVTTMFGYLKIGHVSNIGRSHSNYV